MYLTLLSILTLISSVASLVPFDSDSPLEVTNLAINLDMTEVEIYDAWMRMGEMLEASGKNEDTALIACKGVCFDWNLSASACTVPDQSQARFIACMCNQQNLNTMPPCTDCLANQDRQPQYRQQTQNFVDLCDTLNYSLQNETKSSMFFDDVSTSTGSSLTVSTSTLLSPLSSTSTTSTSPDDVLGGGLTGLTLSTNLLPVATETTSSTSRGRSGIEATATSISNQGAAKTSDQAGGVVGAPTAPSIFAQFAAVCTALYVTFHLG